MNPHDLVRDALSGDDLGARQFVKDAARAGYSWADAPAPQFAEPQECAAYAGLVELMAERTGQSPPAWTSSVGASPTPVYLMRAAEKSKALQQETPGVLKDRNVFASRDYLRVL